LLRETRGKEVVREAPLYARSYCLSESGRRALFVALASLATAACQAKSACHAACLGSAQVSSALDSGALHQRLKSE
jgi:hypothetical protein